MSDLTHRLTAALAGRYRVERELGRGGMATVYLAQDWRHRRSVARITLTLDPDFGAPFELMGHAFGNLGEVDSALAAFGEALRRPQRIGDRDRFRVRAAMAFLRGDVAHALADLERLVQRHPNHIPGHNNLGCLSYLADRYEPALASYGRAVEASPFGPNQTVFNGQFLSLLALGRVAREQRLRCSRLRSPRKPAAGTRPFGSWDRLHARGTEPGFQDHAGRVTLRWLMADAYERLGRPDSAAEYLRLVLAPFGRVDEEYLSRGIAFSFAHRRLVLLNARMGLSTRRVGIGRSSWRASRARIRRCVR